MQKSAQEIISDSGSSQKVNDMNKRNVETWKACLQAAKREYEKGCYDAAEELIERVLKRFETELASCEREYASALHVCATIQREQGQYENAISLYTRAMDLSDQFMDRAQRIELITDMSLCYCLSGEFMPALKLEREAHDLINAQHGPGSDEANASLARLSSLCWITDDLVGATLYLEQYYVHLLNRASERGPSLSTVMTWLGDLYYKREAFTQAEHMYKEALATLEDSCSDELLTAHLMNRLGLSMCAQDLRYQARPICQRAARLRNSTSQGTDQIAHRLNDLADVFCEKGQFDEATTLCQMAHSQDDIDPQSPDTAKLQFYASILKRLGGDRPVDRIERAIWEETFKRMKAEVALSEIA